MTQSQLIPIILIHCYDEQGQEVQFETLPYNGEQEALTNKIDELLELPNVSYVQPIAGYTKK